MTGYSILLFIHIFWLFLERFQVRLYVWVTDLFHHVTTVLLSFENMLHSWEIVVLLH